MRCEIVNETVVLHRCLTHGIESKDLDVVLTHLEEHSFLDDGTKLD